MKRSKYLAFYDKNSTVSLLCGCVQYYNAEHFIIYQRALHNLTEAFLLFVSRLLEKNIL